MTEVSELLKNQNNQPNKNPKQQTHPTSCNATRWSVLLQAVCCRPAQGTLQCSVLGEVPARLCSHCQPSIRTTLTLHLLDFCFELAFVRTVSQNRDFYIKQTSSVILNFNRKLYPFFVWIYILLFYCVHHLFYKFVVQQWIIFSIQPFATNASEICMDITQC